MQEVRCMACSVPTACVRVRVRVCMHANVHVRSPSSPLRSPAQVELGERMGAAKAGGVNPPRSATPPDLQRHPPPTWLVLKRCSEGVPEHLLVRRHLASAWAEAPELAWASTGADRPRPPSVPPAVFTHDLS